MESVKKLKEKYNLTDEHLAESFMTDTETVKKWIAGEAMPDKELFEVVSMLYGMKDMDVEDIL